MSGFAALVQARRSVRACRPDPVSRDLLDACCDAARFAPSACNSQPWRFVIADDAATVAALAAAARGPHGSALNAFAVQAPVIVAVCAEQAALIPRLGGWLRGTDYALMDCAVAAEHFCLRAAEAGLGTCLLGWFSERRVRRLLGLPRRQRVVLLITCGWPADEAPATKLRLPLAAIRRYHSCYPDGN